MTNEKPASPTQGELAVKVKPLERRDCEPGHINGHNGRRIVEKAIMPFGAYFIEHDQDDDTWWLVDGLVGPEIAGPFNEAWEVRKAAQDTFVSAILSALDRTTLPPTEEAWQPIETAPKDRPVLTFRGAGIIAVAEYADDHFPGWCIADGMRIVNVTHWQPLPAAPQGTRT